MTNHERLKELFQRYVERKETLEEMEELMEMMANQGNRSIIEEQLETFRERFDGSGLLTEEQSERVFLSIVKETQEHDAHDEAPVRVRRLNWRLAAAASILILLCAGVLFYYFSRITVLKPDPVNVAAAQDVKSPDAHEAVITLWNGEQLSVDNMANGTSTLQGNSELVKLADGQVAYRANNTSTVSADQLNTLRNPRGSKVIEMILADGSHVWLNAGSSLTYPVSFSAQERNVTITGEAYFEVAKNKEKPFIVNINNQSMVQVLGTKFNINSYTDEQNIKTTLLEGSVRITNQAPSTNAGTPITSKRSVILKPGQQAQILIAGADDHPMQVLNNVMTEQAIAWKNGFFNLNDADVPTVMRQLERWYDITVKYNGAIPATRFKGELDKNINLSDVIDYLSKVGINAKLEGRTLIVQ